MGGGRKPDTQILSMKTEGREKGGGGGRRKGGRKGRRRKRRKWERRAGSGGEEGKKGEIRKTYASCKADRYGVPSVTKLCV